MANRPAATRRIHLHQRDLEILEFVLTRRIETLDALTQRYFNTKKRAYNRLGELSRAGYLQRIPIEQESRLTSAYHLGHKGRPALRLRSLAADAIPSGPPTQTSIPHQLQVNRAADQLGIELIAEGLLGCEHAARHHRPDGGYQARTADPDGRQLVLLEVDLGHYSRARVLGKTATFVEHPDARGVLFLTANQARADLIARWIREAHGEAIMDRVQVLTFDELAAGGLDHRLAPDSDGQIRLYA